MRHLLSQLAHVEILSPRPGETVAFFEQQLGLEISAREGQSVYLRGWGEFFHHRVKITESARSSLGHVGWRAESAEDLADVASDLAATDHGVGWIDGDRGHCLGVTARASTGGIDLPEHHTQSRGIRNKRGTKQWS
jgi:catechol 2,3-dioxygenase